LNPGQRKKREKRKSGRKLEGVKLKLVHVIRMNNFSRQKIWNSRLHNFFFFLPLRPYFFESFWTRKIPVWSWDLYSNQSKYSTKIKANFKTTVEGRFINIRHLWINSNSKQINILKIFIAKTTSPSNFLSGGKIITSIVGYLLFRYLGCNQCRSEPKWSKGRNFFVPPRAPLNPCFLTIKIWCLLMFHFNNFNSVLLPLLNFHPCLVDKLLVTNCI
jgi:hypothetical protein